MPFVRDRNGRLKFVPDSRFSGATAFGADDSLGGAEIRPPSRPALVGVGADDSLGGADINPPPVRGRGRGRDRDDDNGSDRNDPQQVGTRTQDDIIADMRALGPLDLPGYERLRAELRDLFISRGGTVDASVTAADSVGSSATDGRFDIGPPQIDPSIGVQGDDLGVQGVGGVGLEDEPTRAQRLSEEFTTRRGLFGETLEAGLGAFTPDFVREAGGLQFSPANLDFLIQGIRNPGEPQDFRSFLQGGNQLSLSGLRDKASGLIGNVLQAGNRDPTDDLRLQSLQQLGQDLSNDLQGNFARDFIRPFQQGGFGNPFRRSLDRGFNRSITSFFGNNPDSTGLDLLKQFFGR